MQTVGLDELQAGIKISGKNINNLRYAGDITLMAEDEEEVMRPNAMILVFLIFRLKLALSLSSFTLIRRLFSSSSLFVIRVVSSHI